MHWTDDGVCWVQGSVTRAFSGVNKCVVMRMSYVAECDPVVKTGAPVLIKAPVCASESLSVGDLFSVMQVGTVGVVVPPSKQQVGCDSQDRRTSVLHAALVQVRPKDGRTPRCEVFTAQQMRTDYYRVGPSGVVP